MEALSIVLTVIGYSVIFLTVFYARRKNVCTKKVCGGTFTKLMNYIPFFTITPVFCYYIFEYISNLTFKTFIILVHPAWYWLGVALLLISLITYSDSILVMKRNWTIGLELRKKHQLVKEHAFKLIRHPIYASWFGIILSLFFMYGSWLFLISLLPVVVWYTYRALLEEKFLAANLKGYAQYCKQGKMYIPFIV